MGAGCRDRLRDIETGHGHIERVRLLGLRDMPGDRLRRNQIFIAECRSYFLGAGVCPDWARRPDQADRP
jgi:hypothetical protein